MPKHKYLAILLIILLLSILGWGTWLLEIILVRKWYSLGWLNGPLYLPYFGTFIAAITFLIPFKINGVPVKKLMLPVILLYFVNAFCYEVGRQLCLALYCRFCFWETKDIVIIFSIAILLFPLLGFWHWLIVNKLIQKTKKIYMLYIALLLGLGVVLSMITIHLFPGFGHQTAWIDCVKMGYPVFWTIIVLGLSGLTISNQKVTG